MPGPKLPGKGLLVFDIQPLREAVADEQESLLIRWFREIACRQTMPFLSNPGINIGAEFPTEFCVKTGHRLAGGYLCGLVGPDPLPFVTGCRVRVGWNAVLARVMDPHTAFQQQQAEQRRGDYQQQFLAHCKGSGQGRWISKPESDPATVFHDPEALVILQHPDIGNGITVHQ